MDLHESILAGSNAFGLDLWERMRAVRGNLAVSPTSITAALAMLWSGSRYETASQIGAVMRQVGDAHTVVDGWSAIARRLEDPTRRRTLTTANRLFAEKTYGIEPSYVALARAAFGAAPEAVDFRGEPDTARILINRWVEARTRGRIAQLLPPGSVAAETPLVAVNATHFLAQWLTPFVASRTHPREFRTSSGIAKKVPMMHSVGQYRVAQSKDVTVLELPYKGHDTAMLVILPERDDALEASLSTPMLYGWMTALAPQRVNVALPRFAVNPDAVQLVQALADLGMPLAFDPERADFTGIATPRDPQRRLYVGNLVHKSFVKIDEKGTEAAAATTAGLSAPIASRISARPLDFVADHPFLFAIVDGPTNLVLFLGRVADPLPNAA